MGQASTIGLDIAKHIFQAHGADASGRVVFRKRLTRTKLLAFFAAQEPCVVALEACAGAHYWARELGKLGHTVQLIPPAYVKPYVKRQKNDMADAEAICEAATRPSMRFVPVKSEAQQANGVVFRVRDLLVRQRTQCLNALRGHLSEYGYVVAQGIVHADEVIAHVEDPNTALPESARSILAVLIGTFRALEAQIETLDAEITRRAKADPVARRLMTIPGVGPIAATAITALVPAPEGLRAGRDFAAWLGLTPLQRSSGGKQKLGAVSKQGERTIRRLLIIGASAVVRWASQRGAAEGSWLARMLARKPRMLVTRDGSAVLVSDGSLRDGVGQQDGPHRVGLAGQGRRVSYSGRGGVSASRPRGRGANGRRAWRNGRRDGIGTTRLNQRASSTPCVMWTRSANSHAGPRRRAAARPDRWQHPTTRHGSPEVSPCPNGGVHRWFRICSFQVTRARESAGL